MDMLCYMARGGIKVANQLTLNGEIFPSLSGLTESLTSLEVKAGSRKSVSDGMWERLLAIAGFEDGNGPQTKQCGQPIERGIGKNILPEACWFPAFI